MFCWFTGVHADLGQEVMEFGPDDRHVFGRINAKSNLVSTDLDHGNRDPGADVDFFPWLSGQNKHGDHPP